MIEVGPRRVLAIGLYLVATLILAATAAMSSWLWLLVAAVASDGCRGDVCTSAGGHWAAAFPTIALISAVTFALLPPVAVAAFKLPTAWVWVGIPLAIAVYFLAPLLANGGRTAGMW